MQKPTTQQELLRLIDQAADEQWEELDLSWMVLAELPLTNLTQLGLSNNQISAIPESIGQLR